MGETRGEGKERRGRREEKEKRGRVEMESYCITT